MTVQAESRVVPTVSVVITLYNKAPYVKRALASVFQQSLRPLEIIVVDDCSTDDGPMRAVEMLESWREASYQIIHRSKRGGSCARPRMTGFDAASGDHVAYLDADDEWDPDFLEACVWLLKSHPSCSAAGTLRRVREGERLKTPHLDRWNAFSGPINLSLFLQMRLMNLTPIRVPCSVFLRDAIIEAGGFSHAPRSSDVDFIYRFFLAGERYAYCSEPKVTIHRVPGSTMATVSTLPVRTWRLRALEAFYLADLFDLERSLILADIRRSVRSDTAGALREGKMTIAYLCEVRGALPAHERVVLSLAARLPSSPQRVVGGFYHVYARVCRHVSARRLA